MQPELMDQAERWLEQDPDPQTRQELQQLIDSQNTHELTDCLDRKSVV